MDAQRQVLLAYSLAAREEPPADDAAFRRLVGPEGPLAGVTATCFLLSARGFLDGIVPRLLSQLRRAMQPQRVVLRGRARGSVDWGSTIRARSGGSQDPTIFVCRQSWRLYDLPENQLLKYLLDQLRRYHHRMPAALKSWAWSPPGDQPAWPQDRVDKHLARLAHRLRRYEKNAYLRDIELPPTIDSKHLQAARGSRNRLYNETAVFYEHFASAVESPNWTAWTRMLRCNATLLPREEAQALAEIMAPIDQT